MEQTFFGFKPEDRVQLHDTLFNLLWHGDGKWTWTDIYNLPVYLRRFWISKINKMIEDTKQKNEQRAAKLSAQKNKVVKSPL